MGSVGSNVKNKPLSDNSIPEDGRDIQSLINFPIEEEDEDADSGNTVPHNENEDVQYEMDFTEQGVKVHHIHYVNGRQVYEIYDAETGKYIDEAETTTELTALVDEYNERKRKNTKA